MTRPDRQQADDPEFIRRLSEVNNAWLLDRAVNTEASREYLERLWNEFREWAMGEREDEGR